MDSRFADDHALGLTEFARLGDGGKAGLKSLTGVDEEMDEEELGKYQT
jgi:hypothetical protein